MTRTLILMRHAKSNWSQIQHDHDRPLNTRGRNSAVALGNWLRDANHIPDEILCSSSVRTRETLKYLELSAQVRLLPELYHASREGLINIIQKAQGTRVLVIGHNPGIGELAESIVQEAPDHSRFHDYPTGATLVVDLAINTWAALAQQKGELVDFTFPRDL